VTKEVMLRARAGGGGTRATHRWMTIDIADVCGDIASAVVRSTPCREYVHLVRADDGWKIVDALWLPQ
jgi:Putative lumazine-binding